LLTTLPKIIGQNISNIMLATNAANYPYSEGFNRYR